MNNNNTESTHRVYNYSAGPGALPEPVLKQARESLLDYNGTGISVMEMNHRSQEFLCIGEQTRAKLKSLLEVPDNFTILLLQGGATN
mmetsp:Transcript_11471/g.14432  ORF Transcript_11471/g.14432 Transcript_11471/m.14432 type:complete len:87 (+) Transcript_11471:23-283(+)